MHVPRLMVERVPVEPIVGNSKPMTEVPEFLTPTSEHRARKNGRAV
ncbi:hypothetical protein EYZ11_008114 [Aspergillus tanneri]|uniref:Uncharacterized protein n=1 Tax=Aspergillus tanneri TaxID=1220188 RepID=A0A4V3UNT9_9EURO|nr:hypothetical protein EYZ11_008114 [Aspergillus tanneri]